MQIEFTDSNGFAFLENLGFRAVQSDAALSCRSQAATSHLSLAPSLISRRRLSAALGNSNGNVYLQDGDAQDEGFALAGNVTAIQVGTSSSFHVGDVGFPFRIISRDSPERYLVQDEVALIGCQSGCVSFAGGLAVSGSARFDDDTTFKSSVTVCQSFAVNGQVNF